MAFFTFAGLTLISAIAAMTMRNLVYCGLCSAAAFAGIAAIYLQLSAEFVGFAQFLVYVGAIAILIVFTVLLTRGTDIKPTVAIVSRGWIAGVVIAGLVFASISVPVFMSATLWRTAPPEVAAPVEMIGLELMTRYILPLEAIGLLLTVALIGAVVIAMREKPAESIEPEVTDLEENSTPAPRFDVSSLEVKS
ncbi:MAG: NADH-quinone oxidoreductase subunit J [Verrucomicrobia bacterium]|nr:NADH-quinone oxidoreductase subunit J [Verrucomicrobiota bacterium]